MRAPPAALRIKLKIRNWRSSILTAPEPIPPPATARPEGALAQIAPCRGTRQVLRLDL